MKQLNLAAFLVGTFVFAGCCDCFDNAPPNLKIQLEGFSAEELKSVYVIDNDVADTCFNCVDTTNNSTWIFARPNSQYEIGSDSIPLHKIVQINKIKTETSGFGRCKCNSETRINYDYDGNSYTNEPVIITR